MFAPSLPLSLTTKALGKTAVAEAVAQAPADPALFHFPLRGHRLVSVELASLVAGTKHRGEFEDRLQAIATQSRSLPTILFWNEPHNLVGSGCTEGGLAQHSQYAEMGAGARGAMQVIGGTTVSEFRQFIEKDAGLESLWRT